MVLLDPAYYRIAKVAAGQRHRFALETELDASPRWTQRERSSVEPPDPRRTFGPAEHFAPALSLDPALHHFLLRSLAHRSSHWMPYLPLPTPHRSRDSRSSDSSERPKAGSVRPLLQLHCSVPLPPFLPLLLHQLGSRTGLDAEVPPRLGRIEIAQKRVWERWRGMVEERG